MSAFIDLTGQTFGRLYVIKRVENKVVNSRKKVEKIQYLCRCVCGNEVVVTGEGLKTGHTKSCGCLYQQRVKYPIQYEFVNGYVRGYNCRGESFLIDKKDYELISQYHWYKGKHRYWCNKKLGSMSCFLMKTSDEKRVVDHINGNTDDNRRSNLRLCTQSQNSMNRHYGRIVGVSQKGDKWRARIKINQKLLQLGIFNTKEEAIKVRKEAEEKYFGKYQVNN